MCICAPFEHPVPKEMQQGMESSETAVTDGCELPCECWEINPGLQVLWMGSQVGALNH